MLLLTNVNIRCHKMQKLKHPPVPLNAFWDSGCESAAYCWKTLSPCPLLCPNGTKILSNSNIYTRQ